MFASEVGVRSIAAVDDRDRDARPVHDVPGSRRIHARGRFEVVPLLVVARVVRREHSLQQPILFDVLDCGIRGESSQ